MRVQYSHSRKIVFIHFLSFLLLGCIDQTNPSGKSIPDDNLTGITLPEYESQIDHKYFISSWDKESMARGLTIYRTTCYPCHGDIDHPGSLPNSKKFWAGSFGNGSDPYALYQTITKGFGEMPPQMHLVPQQKYDVIQYLQEAFIKGHNPEAYKEVTNLWLDSLPTGNERGPAAKPYHPWKDMDYGNWLIQCYEMADNQNLPKIISSGKAPMANEDYQNVNFAYKGIAIRLDEGDGGIAQGKAFVMFDHDLLRFVGAWSGEGFIDWESILLDDQHNVYPRTVGTVDAINPITPGWANPSTGSFDDLRIKGLDGRRFGPLPKTWARYKGLFNSNGKPIIQYEVGDAEVLEMYEVNDFEDHPVFNRIIHIAKSSRSLKMRILPDTCHVKLISDHGVLKIEDGFFVLQVPANQETHSNIYFSTDSLTMPLNGLALQKIPNISALAASHPQQQSMKLSTEINAASSTSAYTVDVLNLPVNNPYNSRMRPTGIDFINDGADALLCTIDGEVWKVSGITKASGTIGWKRIATGLFQPLGIKEYKDEIYVGCRDQIVKLIDLNGDELIDYYECFNSDHQVTEHFHEFAMGLQVDENGNFYYAKSGRHARTSLVPQHGTLIKVSSDGSNSTILANGFRAANGVCLNPDGSFYVTDQEGYWNPMNRINRIEKGGFYGNMWGYGAPIDSSDAGMRMPLCWVDKAIDRSPAELLWANSDRWGPLNHSLLSLSYGTGKIFVILPQEIQGIHQGGIIELPIPQSPTGLTRGRFNPKDGQLYACGMSAWGSNQMLQTGGLYRIKYNQQPLHLPIKMEISGDQIILEFSDPIDKSSGEDENNYGIKTWQLKRTRNYGSKRYDQKELEISALKLESNGTTLSFTIPQMKPTWGMEIKYAIYDEQGTPISGLIQNTIYSTGEHSEINL